MSVEQPFVERRKGELDRLEQFRQFFFMIQHFSDTPRVQELATEALEYIEELIGRHDKTDPPLHGM